MADDLACTECMWTGDSYEKVYDNECPECGAGIEWIKKEYLPYQNDYNWNKP